MSVCDEVHIVYDFGPTVASSDASIGRYSLRNATIREAEDFRMVPERGTLDMVMPKSEAVFLNTNTDLGYWWYPIGIRCNLSQGRKCWTTNKEL